MYRATDNSGRFVSTGTTMRDNPTYRTWKAMIDRCRPSAANSKHYYDKGIRVCDEWLGEEGYRIEGFNNFLEDMGDRPEGLTLDRIDGNKGYSPDNCRWATYKVQGNNTSRNQTITYQGQTKTYAEWADHVGCHRHTIRSRVLAGWEIEKIVTTPANHGNKWLELSNHD